MGDIPPEDEGSSKGSSETTSSRRRKQATEDGSSSSSDIEFPASKIPKTSHSAEKSVHIQASLPPGQSIDGSSPFIILSESTHDIQRTEHHLGQTDLTSRLEVAINTTNERVTSRWPTRDHPYSKVSVLLLSWKDDDLGVRREVNQLRSLFADTFNYDVDEWQLPSGPRCYLALLNRLDEFTLDNGGPDTLIIIYYGGHAYQSAKRASFGPIWVSYV